MVTGTQILYMQLFKMDLGLTIKKSEDHLASIYISNSVTIFGININIDVDKLSHGKLSKLAESRISLKTLILRNNGKTGFLMWISSYCVACIYQQNTTARFFHYLQMKMEFICIRTHKTH